VEEEIMNWDLAKEGFIKILKKEKDMSCGEVPCTCDEPVDSNLKKIKEHTQLHEMSHDTKRFIAAVEMMGRIFTEVNLDKRPCDNADKVAHIAAHCVQQADALLKELEK